MTTPHKHRIPPPVLTVNGRKALRQWLDLHTKAWDGWPTHQSDTHDAASRVARLAGYPLPPACATRLVDFAREVDNEIAALRSQRRARYIASVAKVL